MPHCLRPRKVVPRPEPSDGSAEDCVTQNQSSSRLQHFSPSSGSVDTSAGEERARSADDADDLSTPKFSTCYNKVMVVDSGGRPVNVDFSCTMSRGFFKVKQDWICYRRNYINVSATLLSPTTYPVFLRLPDFHEIKSFAFVVSAVTAADPPRPIDLIQHTPKRDKGPQRSPQFVPVMGTTVDASWDRLQYKTATANNGKKRGQQFFSIKLTLLAWIEYPHNTWIEVADKFSEAMIVRGRSPGHYNDSTGPHVTPPSFEDFGTPVTRFPNLPVLANWPISSLPPSNAREAMLEPGFRLPPIQDTLPQHARKLPTYDQVVSGHGATTSPEIVEAALSLASICGKRVHEEDVQVPPPRKSARLQ